MGQLPPILIGVGIATVVAVLARHLLRARLGASTDPAAATAWRRLATEVTLGTIGLLLMVLSLVVGFRMLQIDGPPRGELFRAGPGIATEVAARPDRGFVAGLGVTFRGCDEPVEGVLAFAGTAEFFEDNASALAGATRFSVAVPGTDEIHDVRVVPGDGYYDALAPITFEPDQGVGDVGRTVERRRLDVTSVSGAVEDWRNTLVSVVVTFRADWLERRGLGTCYLRLPPLVGTATVIGAQDGLGRGVRPDTGTLPDAVADEVSSNDGEISVPYRRSLAIVSAISVVDVGRHEVIDGGQDANAVVAGQPAVACRALTPRTSDLGDRDAHLVGGPFGGYAVRADAFAPLAVRDCGRVVTIAEAGSGSRRDLVLLLVGALFSFGAAMLLEVALDVHRRRVARQAA